jgi:hypothetical protein
VAARARQNRRSEHVKSRGRAHRGVVLPAGRNGCSGSAADMREAIERIGGWLRKAWVGVS